MTNAEDQKTLDRIEALEKGQIEIINLLRPIAETYTSVSTMSKFFMSLAVFISIIIGIWIGWLQINGK